MRRTLSPNAAAVLALTSAIVFADAAHSGARLTDEQRVVICPPQVCGPPPLSNELYGFISSNTTLTYGPPGPVYEVLGDLVVVAGVTLTIEPGVTLRFAANHDTLSGGNFPSLSELEVRGTLIADASIGDSIRLVSSLGGPIEWGVVYIAAGGTVALRNAVIDGPTTALSFAAGTTGSVRNTSIARCNYGILADLATVSVQECVIGGRGFSIGDGLRVGPGVVTAPADSNAASPTVVYGFENGATVSAGSLLQNCVLRDNRRGIQASDAIINYCTVVRNAEFGIDAGTCLVLNAIAAMNSVGVRACGGWVDYVDSWSSDSDFQDPCGPVQGTHNASFDPFFLDPQADDFRLAENSIFKTFSNSGGEIGAYGPSCPPATSVDAKPRPTTLRAWPNPSRGQVLLDRGPDLEPVDVIDLGGRVVRRLNGAETGPVSWDGRDSAGKRVAPGVYLWKVGSSGGIGRVAVIR
jgi:hypothetical protein